MDNKGLQTGGSRDQFKSKFGFIMAIAGSAVGLGNIWKFPYMTGQNGGGAFVLVYLISILLIGASLIVVELTIGRNSGSSVTEAYGKFNKKFKFAGFYSMIAVTVLLSYYIIIGGWTIFYFVEIIGGKLIGLSPDQLNSTFGNFISNTGMVWIYTIIFLAMTTFVITKGISKGIEKACSIMMPALFVMLILLIIRSITLPGAMKGVSWYLKPDFSKITGSTLVAAVGQAFFSLSLGSGSMVTYASYLKKDENIPQAAFATMIADTLVALLAGLVILPAVFAFGVSPGEGPGLIFVTLPGIFGQMPFGTFFAAVFFILFFFAALTSSISMLEVSVTYIIEKTNMNRKAVSIIMSIVVLILGIPPLMSFGGWSHIQIFGKGFFDLYDYFVSNISMPLVGLAGTLVIGYVWKKKDVENEVTNNGEVKFKAFNLWYNLVKYVVPVLLIIIFLTATGILKI